MDKILSFLEKSKNMIRQALLLRDGLLQIISRLNELLNYSILKNPTSEKKELSCIFKRIEKTHPSINFEIQKREMPRIFQKI